MTPLARKKNRTQQRSKSRNFQATANLDRWAAELERAITQRRNKKANTTIKKIVKTLGETEKTKKKPERSAKTNKGPSGPSKGIPETRAETPPPSKPRSKRPSAAGGKHRPGIFDAKDDSPRARPNCKERPNGRFSVRSDGGGATRRTKKEFIPWCR